MDNYEFPDAGDIEIRSGTGVCDFCSPRKPSAWVYPCRNFPLPIPAVSEMFGGRIPMSDGDWGACIDCAELIEKGHRDKLARQAAQAFALGYQAEVIRRFFEHRIDKPRYNVEGEPHEVYDEIAIIPNSTWSGRK